MPVGCLVDYYPLLERPQKKERKTSDTGDDEIMPGAPGEEEVIDDLEGGESGSEQED